MEKIMAAIDFSDVTEAIIKKTIDLALAFDANVCIIHVEPDGDVYAHEEDNREMQMEIYHNIDIIRKKFNDKNLFPYFKEATGMPSKCILNECERFKPDVLILGDHRHSKFMRIFSDKLREELILKAPCSVMVVHHDD